MVVTLALVAATLITAAAGADEAPSPGVVVTWIREISRDGPAEPTATRLPGATETPKARGVPTATPAIEELTGFAYPIAEACLPRTDALLPGAPREYRKGVHEGVDFYDGASCAPIARGTEVLAAKAGTVVRADWSYEDLTVQDVEFLMAAVELNGSTDEDVLDAFRGRQVWVDHGNGIVTRYAHLEAIAEDITEGAVVGQGELIGYVGESGTPESVTDPGAEVHLHFEIRVGESYLGAGLDAAAVRGLYERAFSAGEAESAES